MVLTPTAFEAIVLSLQVAILSVVISLPMALLIGHQMARRDFPGKPVVESILHLPLVMPPVATGYLLLLLLGTNGFLGQFLTNTLGIKLAFAFPAAVIASVVVSFPLMVRSIRTAIELVDVGLEQTSRMLGASSLKTFYRITLPLAMPGVISGTLLSFTRSLGEFGATISFAGNIPGETQTLPLAIYSLMQVPGEENATLTLVGIAVLISFAAMILSEWSIKKMKHG